MCSCGWPGDNVEVDRAGEEVNRALRFLESALKSHVDPVLARLVVFDVGQRERILAIAVVARALRHRSIELVRDIQSALVVALIIERISRLNGEGNAVSRRGGSADRARETLGVHARGVDVP